jgi:hypothetical protein
MALYLTISEGPSPGEAVPYLVTGDQAIIRAVATELAKRLGISDAKVLSVDRKFPSKSAHTENLQS